MPDDALRTTGRVIRIIRRAVTTLVAEAYPTIDDPQTGSVVAGGENLTVTVETNQPGMTHTVRLLRDDGTTELQSAPVTFPGGASPGTATIPMPAGGAADAEYFLEVVPASGPPHRIVVRVLAAGTPLAVAVDYGGNPPGAYNVPVDLVLTGVGSGGTPPYAYQWTAADTVLSSTDTLSIQLSASGSTYTFTCRVTDNAAATATADVVYSTN